MNAYLYAKDYDRYAKAAMDHFSRKPFTTWSELNEAAWNFYLHVNDVDQLNAALSWAIQSIRILPRYSNIDTAACLYVKLGLKVWGRELAEKVIHIGTQNREDVSSTQNLLASLTHYVGDTLPISK